MPAEGLACFAHDKTSFNSRANLESYIFDNMGNQSNDLLMLVMAACH